MYVQRYGLERFGDVRWFYRLSRRDQVDALALLLPPLKSPKRTRATHKGAPLVEQVDPASELGWLLGDE